MMTPSIFTYMQMPGVATRDDQSIADCIYLVVVTRCREQLHIITKLLLIVFT